MSSSTSTIEIAEADSTSNGYGRQRLPVENNLIRLYGIYDSEDEEQELQAEIAGPADSSTHPRPISPCYSPAPSEEMVADEGPADSTTEVAAPRVAAAPNSPPNYMPWLLNLQEDEEEEDEYLLD